MMMKAGESGVGGGKVRAEEEPSGDGALEKLLRNFARLSLL